ncbi:MAG: hypothetical protein QXP27_06460, partial [Candidatus Methanomethyliaceae archaeon]
MVKIGLGFKEKPHLRLLVAILGLAMAVGIVVGFETRAAFLVLGLLAAIIIFLRPYLGLLLLPVLHVFAINASPVIDLPKVAYYLLMMIVLVGGLLRIYKDRLISLGSYPVFKSTALLGLIVSLSILPAVFNNVPLEHWLRSASTLLGIFLVFPAAALLDSPKRISIFVTVLIIAIWLSAFGTAHQMMKVRGFLPSGFSWIMLSEGRPLVGASLAITLMGMYLGLGYAIHRYKPPRKFVIPLASFPVAILTVLVCIAGLILSGFSSVFLLGFAGVPVLLMLRKSYAHLSYGKIAALAIIFLAAYFFFVNLLLSQAEVIPSEIVRAGALIFYKIETLREEGLWASTSWLGRWYEAMTALQAFISSPIWGYGFGYEEFKGLYGSTNVPFGFYIHSIIPSWLIRSGIIGLSAWVWYLWTVLKLFRKAYKHVLDPMYAMLFKAAFAGSIAVLVVSQVSSLYDDRGYGLMMGLLSGLA